MQDGELPRTPTATVILVHGAWRTAPAGTRLFPAYSTKAWNGRGQNPLTSSKVGAGIAAVHLLGADFWP